MRKPAGRGRRGSRRGRARPRYRVGGRRSCSHGPCAARLAPAVFEGQCRRGALDFAPRPGSPAPVAVAEGALVRACAAHCVARRRGVCPPGALRRTGLRPRLRLAARLPLRRRPPRLSRGSEAVALEPLHRGPRGLWPARRARGRADQLRAPRPARPHRRARRSSRLPRRLRGGARRAHRASRHGAGRRARRLARSGAPRDLAALLRRGREQRERSSRRAGLDGRPRGPRAGAPRRTGAPARRSRDRARRARGNPRSQPRRPPPGAAPLARGRRRRAASGAASPRPRTMVVAPRPRGAGGRMHVAVPTARVDRAARRVLDDRPAPPHAAAVDLEGRQRRALLGRHLVGRAAQLPAGHARHHDAAAGTRGGGCRSGRRVAARADGGLAARLLARGRDRLLRRFRPRQLRRCAARAPRLPGARRPGGLRRRRSARGARARGDAAALRRQGARRAPRPRPSPPGWHGDLAAPPLSGRLLQRARRRARRGRGEIRDRVLGGLLS